MDAWHAFGSHVSSPSEHSTKLFTQAFAFRTAAEAPSVANAEARFSRRPHMENLKPRWATRRDGCAILLPFGVKRGVKAEGQTPRQMQGCFFGVKVLGKRSSLLRRGHDPF